MTSDHTAFYRRMGNMEEHLGGNAMSLRGLWRSPRGTVLRIEALALVAITLSFFLAFFGSCRRWSNRWIVQKGFLAAQVLSLSLGTYSIGLMQSSPVKSEMYSIWAVSLLTLFGCVDPITRNIDLDYKGPLSRMIFQLCLYFGYVMLMSVSTISSDLGMLAIVSLSTITFMKGFHSALAFVLPGEIRDVDITQIIPNQATEPAALAGSEDGSLEVYSFENSNLTTLVTMADIQELSLLEATAGNDMTIKDVCLSYSFSHRLRKRFIGLDTASEMDKKLEVFKRLGQDAQLTTMDYKRVLKVVEVELGFLFEAFFTSNEFLHLYQAKTGSFWALASFIGICFVGVVVAITIIHGKMASHHNLTNSSATDTSGAGASTSNIVGTTVADLIITLVILVSLALLQLVQLIRCWTSNWARVGIACEYAIKAKKQIPQRRHSNTRRRSNDKIIIQWVMRLRLFLVNRVNWFDKYLWQARLGQDSLAALLQRRRTHGRKECVLSMACCWCCCFCCDHVAQTCVRWVFRVGLRYFWRLVTTLLLSETTNPGGAVRLHEDVKASVAEFLATIKSRRIGVEWSGLFVENGLQDWFEYLPYTNHTSIHVWFRFRGVQSKVSAFMWRVMIWHIATLYCEEAEKEGGDSSSISREKNRHVAMDLSKYCLYLVVSAPELLPGPATETKKALEEAQEAISYNLDDEETNNMLKAMQQVSLSSDGDGTLDVFVTGVYLGKRLRNDEMKTPPILVRETEEGLVWKKGEHSTQRPCSTDHWELLALLWVQTLLYAAPYGEVQAHMQRLAQGGEFITHLWALLYHLGIDKWEVADIDELKAAAAAETTTEAQVQKEDAGSGSEIEEIN